MSEETHYVTEVMYFKQKKVHGKTVDYLYPKHYVFEVSAKDYRKLQNVNNVYIRTKDPHAHKKHLEHVLLLDLQPVTKNFELFKSQHYQMLDVVKVGSKLDPAKTELVANLILGDDKDEDI